MDRKAAIREYKLGPRPMAVFQIRNTVNERVFVDSSINFPGKINRHKFQLNAGNHPVKDLQTDWKQFGEATFKFEILEEYSPSESAVDNAKEDLAALEALWLEKLTNDGVELYNERKLTREERLAMIAANNRGKF
ncbi:MAG TPA: GIY-YIG nuclease family protein [Pyrinomonadaceae bacterium]|nr:GIY-YIG nuclease family protein [Pyrinomonadaceae bacterium]HMU33769.1 GIY-YIG nuclease family protein [Pyrinomonadaceae bacterium]